MVLPRCRALLPMTKKASTTAYILESELHSMREIQVQVPMNIPNTPKEWELYTDNCPDALLVQAAVSLTSALEKAMNEVARGGRKTTAYTNHLHPVMEMYARLGATGTEPREIAFSYLERAAIIGLR